MEVIYKEESYKIMGLCFEVYNEYGNGFDEPIYHESLMKELTWARLPAVSEPQVNVYYKGERLEKYFKPDIVVYDKIILELKAVRTINEFHRKQVYNYLKATGYKLGIIVNFGAEDKLEYERIVK